MRFDHCRCGYLKLPAHPLCAVCTAGVPTTRVVIPDPFRPALALSKESMKPRGRAKALMEGKKRG